MEASTQILPSIALIMALGLLPLIAVTVTSFTKVSVVLLIVRNALGIQASPPNIVIYGIALVLSISIMSPVVSQINAKIGPHNQIASMNDLVKLATDAVGPVKDFLNAHVTSSSRDLFLGVVKTPTGVTANPNDFSILVPTFLVDELTRAFEIGVRIYLPFVAIDILVSAVLIAMGMQMMSPTTISTPLKLLLFVVANGWGRLLQSLLLSYQ